MPEAKTRRRGDTFLERLAGEIEAIARGGGPAALAPPGEGDARLGRLRDAAEQLVGAYRRARAIGRDAGGTIQEILATTRQQATAASQQVGAISDITTTIEELNEVGVQNVEKAEGIIQIAEQSEQISQDGQRDVVAAIEGIDRLRSQVELIAAKILELTERTQQIGEIITSVNEIAEQS
jgi:methyl-accepting chemotaxis protein